VDFVSSETWAFPTQSGDELKRFIRRPAIRCADTV
jgi:hypothetical protein